MKIRTTQNGEWTLAGDILSGYILTGPVRQWCLTREEAAGLADDPAGRVYAFVTPCPYGGWHAATGNPHDPNLGRCGGRMIFSAPRTALVIATPAEALAALSLLWPRYHADVIPFERLASS